MAIKLSAAYSKKAGLPGYSSHSFSVSIETELQNLDNVREESARLYESLQLKRSLHTAGKPNETVVSSIVAPDGAPVGTSAGASCSEERLAILQCFDSNCLYGARNRLQVAV
jgi:hypothetical protein